VGDGKGIPEKSAVITIIGSVSGQPIQTDVTPEKKAFNLKMSKILFLCRILLVPAREFAALPQTPSRICRGRVGRIEKEINRIEKNEREKREVRGWRWKNERVPLWVECSVRHWLLVK